MGPSRRSASLLLRLRDGARWAWPSWACMGSRYALRLMFVSTVRPPDTVQVKCPCRCAPSMPGRTVADPCTHSAARPTGSAMTQRRGAGRGGRAAGDAGWAVPDLPVPPADSEAAGASTPRGWHRDDPRHTVRTRMAEIRARVLPGARVLLSPYAHGGNPREGALGRLVPARRARVLQGDLLQRAQDCRSQRDAC